MSDFGFPKQTRSQRVGRAGEAWFESFVTSVLGWVYRPVHRESDFGIDGYIDIVAHEAVTGRTLAVQVKCGDSFVAKKTAGGIKFEGSNRHLNYYLNQDVPVILVVLSSNCEEGYWVEFDITRTNRTSVGWWIEIPRRNQLNEQVVDHWSRIAGPVDDFSDGIRLMWNVDHLLEGVDYRRVAVPLEEVQTCSMGYIVALLNRLSKTRESMLASRGKLEIYFPGFDTDPRELYQIPEVRRWFTTSIEYGIPWFYFLDTRGRGDSIRLLLLSTIDVEIKLTEGGRHLIEIPAEERVEWLMKNFENLNLFTTTHEVPGEINKERCGAILECLERENAYSSRNVWLPNGPSSP